MNTGNTQFVQVSFKLLVREFLVVCKLLSFFHIDNILLEFSHLFLQTYFFKWILSGYVKENTLFYFSPLNWIRTVL